MNSDGHVAKAFQLLRLAIARELPTLVDELRSPQPIPATCGDGTGTEQLRDLWSLTGGQDLDSPGVIGGLQLLGCAESEHERHQWLALGVTGEGADAVVRPQWDSSTSLQSKAVRGVYFAAGWIPVMKEPREANYLAVDTVPLTAGRPGQIILCGRDEDQKCVVAPDLAGLLGMLADDAQDGNWLLCSNAGHRRVIRRKGRLLSACKDGTLLQR